MILVGFGNLIRYSPGDSLRNICIRSIRSWYNPIYSETINYWIIGRTELKIDLILIYLQLEVILDLL